VCNFEFNFKEDSDIAFYPDGKTAGDADGLLYGFLTEENKESFDELRIAELSNAFSQYYWGVGTRQTFLNVNNDGVKAVYGDSGYIPVSFVCRVPGEGNYEIGVELFADDDSKETIIFLGRRRLADVVSLKKGERYFGKYVTNVCAVIPRTFSRPFSDETVNVTIIGENVRLSSVTVCKSSVKTIYIAGDSTVTDQDTSYPYLPEQSYSGWGQMLSYYAGSNYAVSNHAHSGLTTASFSREGHYSILSDRIDPGDICLFQFGHNDQKLAELKADEGYRDYLIKYIDEISNIGAVPVIVSPLARNSWKGDGTYNDLLADYAVVCQTVCMEKNVLFIDLHKYSVDFIKENGLEKAKKYFFPSDYTHTNDFGAFLFAGFIADELYKAGVFTGISGKSDVWSFPKEMRAINVPKELSALKVPSADLFENLERPDDMLLRYEAWDFVIKAMKFFPTNVYNDMFSDVVGHETYAGSVQCAWISGIITKEDAIDGNICPLDKVTVQDFFKFLNRGFKARNGMDIDMEGMEAQVADTNSYISRKEAAKLCNKIYELI